MREIALLTRVDGDATAVTNDLRAMIRRLDSEMPFYQVRTMEQVVSASVATPRSLAWLLSGFAASGLLLAAIGVFGVLSHAVSQRTPDIGVRVAVGSSPQQVLTMVLREGLAQVGIGLILGMALAAATSRLLSGLLFGVTTAAVLPYVVVSFLLLASALSPASRLHVARCESTPRLRCAEIDGPPRAQSMISGQCTVSTFTLLPARSATSTQIRPHARLVSRS